MSLLRSFQSYSKFDFYKYATASQLSCRGEVTSPLLTGHMYRGTACCALLDDHFPFLSEGGIKIRFAYFRKTAKFEDKTNRIEIMKTRIMLLIVALLAAWQEQQHRIRTQSGQRFVAVGIND